jgi:D-proline reductase (dithiol) PrdB
VSKLPEPHTHVEARDKPSFEDDSAGFDLIEREYIREELVPDFEWLDFATPSPRNRLPVPLAQARVALVATAGAHLPDQRRMGAGGDVRMISIDAPEIVLSHEGYDIGRAARDPEVVYPVRTLRALADAGVIGSLAPTAVSTMGYVPRGRRVLERVVPATIDRLRSEEVDLALLVPA